MPNYPDASRFWQVCDKHKVNIFYTAPTAIRALMREGDGPVTRTDRSSVRLLGTVGEPINPEAWQWYYDVVGGGRCPIVDTWWQTETGGIMITPLPGAIEQKPGSATLPFFGIRPVIVDGAGKPIEGEGAGNLCIADGWPGMMRTVYGDHQRFIDTYFKTYPGMYFTGDGCRRDADGYYWITGRVDDVINVAGHRMGTAEVESALVAHGKVAEAAVVGYPHDIKGQGIYAYVTLNAGEDPSDALRKELAQWVAQGDRPDRDARSAPVGAGPAEDPLGQDHAPHPAQDRRQRARPAGRHLDARRPGGRRRFGRQPDEPVGQARRRPRGGRGRAGGAARAAMARASARPVWARPVLASPRISGQAGADERVRRTAKRPGDRAMHVDETVARERHDDALEAAALGNDVAVVAVRQQGRRRPGKGGEAVEGGREVEAVGRHGLVRDAGERDDEVRQDRVHRGFDQEVEGCGLRQLRPGQQHGADLNDLAMLARAGPAARHRALPGRVFEVEHDHRIGPAPVDGRCIHDRALIEPPP